MRCWGLWPERPGDYMCFWGALLSGPNLIEDIVESARFCLSGLFRSSLIAISAVGLSENVGRHTVYMSRWGPRSGS